jgi:hypothetical protein
VELILGNNHSPLEWLGCSVEKSIDKLLKVVLPKVGV